MPMGSPIKWIVFDVNETLLDLVSLDVLFDRHFGRSELRASWFNEVLKSAFVSTIVGPYRDFGVVARSALQVVATREGILLTEESASEILGEMRRLTPHPDVRPGIETLHEAGFRMAALTNSPPTVAEAQIQNAGLRSFLEHVMSVDASASLKPARIVYEDAATHLNASPAEIMLIAAHDWDIAGAMNAGWQGIFIERPGKIWNPLYDSPTFTAQDLQDAAKRLIPRTADS